MYNCKKGNLRKSSLLNTCFYIVLMSQFWLMIIHIVLYDMVVDNAATNVLFNVVLLITGCGCKCTCSQNDISIKISSKV